MFETIGQQLKNARLERNLTLEQVFESTHIRIKYLEALEADDFSVMPSPVQGRGFLRLYAQHLELDIDRLLDEMRRAETIVPDFVKEGETEDEVVDDESVPDEADESLWARLLRRMGVSLASPEVAPAQEAESPPITEANLTPALSRVEASAPEPEPVMGLESEPEADIQPIPTEIATDSQSIFAKIGAELRERREMLSLTHDEIEGHIHVRQHYLLALEAGRFDQLPSPVQTRGMLNNYATFLDLDAEAMLLSFAEGLQTQRLERHPDLAVRPGRRAKKTSRKFSLRSFMAPDLIFGVGVIVILIGLSVWGVKRIAAVRSDTVVEATAPSISEILLATPTFPVAKEATPTLVVNTPSAGEGTPVPFEAPPEDERVGVQLFVTVTERTWMRVTVDGEVKFEGRVQPGGDFIYEGDRQIEILTGNAAGLSVTYNQRNLGLMGSFGEVVQRIYGLNGILTPTITPTLPATATPTVTITPSPTSTPAATEAGATE
ncbi:MAG: hypothetical protein B6I38_01925 [Anaerolineaceae bacterium 4572_5.1]|nr:MAG: hypothetical protein B6I38_01925 [Anaerolineaceae bacterium 4572_5.1]